MIFQLVGDNSLTTLSQEFRTTILESLTPQKILHLHANNELTTPHSVGLTFDLSKELHYISNKLLFELYLRDEYNVNFEKLVNLSFGIHDNGKVTLELNDLKYANSRYELKIRIKSTDSPFEEEKWSEFANVIFKTSAKIPEVVPKMCDNCFNILDNGKIMLYWTKVKKAYQSGDDFVYVVQVWAGKNLIKNVETSKTHFLWDEGSTSEKIKVLIYSKNIQGISKNYTQLSLPREQRPQQQLNIRKELFDNVYKVSWGLLNDSDIKSYTLIWCSQKDERLNQCEDAIEYREFPLHTSTFSLKAASDSFQFGLSANSKYYKSGFQWAKCTTAKSNGKNLDILVERIGSFQLDSPILFIRNWPSQHAEDRSNSSTFH